MPLKTMNVLLEGTAPLMMHRSQLANPFNDYARELSRLNQEKKRKGADKDAILRLLADVEWEGGLYYDDKRFGEKPKMKMGPYIPTEMVRATIRQGAKLSKGGKKVERALIIMAGKFPLEYEGPREFAKLFKDRSFWDQRMVRVGTSRVLRTRPIFHPPWKVKIEVAFNTDGLQADELLKFISDAGTFEGFGDSRSMGFGRFIVKKSTKPKNYS